MDRQEEANILTAALSLNIFTVIDNKHLSAEQISRKAKIKLDGTRNNQENSYAFTGGILFGLAAWTRMEFLLYDLIPIFLTIFLYGHKPINLSAKSLTIFLCWFFDNSPVWFLTIFLRVFFDNFLVPPLVR